MVHGHVLARAALALELLVELEHGALCGVVVVARAAAARGVAVGVGGGGMRGRGAGGLAQGQGGVAVRGGGGEGVRGRGADEVACAAAAGEELGVRVDGGVGFGGAEGEGHCSLLFFLGLGFLCGVVMIQMLEG